jgi:hypothetical protein
MNSRQWQSVLAGLLAAPVPFIAHAETFLTESQAAGVLFPGVKLEPRWMDLTPSDVKTIQKASREHVLDPRVRIFWGPGKEALIIDQVAGKHDFITYAVAINPDGKVKGIEIMDYRETFGYQVREADWRKQFVGKSSADPVKVNSDIRNISGATISSVHVANGVRRVLQTYEILKTKV